jgi:hypothetical protein
MEVEPFLLVKPLLRTVPARARSCIVLLSSIIEFTNQNGERGDKALNQAYYEASLSGLNKPCPYSSNGWI